MFTIKYMQYIRSPEWRARSRHCLARANDRCQICGGAASQAHHSSYIHFGNELDSELIAVCGYCHGWVTFAIRLRRFWRYVSRAYMMLLSYIRK